MAKKLFRLQRGNVILSLVSFSVSAISFVGVVFKNDLTGRIIFGFVWLFIGLLWLSGLLQLMSKKKLTSGK